MHRRQHVYRFDSESFDDTHGRMVAHNVLFDQSSAVCIEYVGDSVCKLEQCWYVSNAVRTSFTRWLDDVGRPELRKYRLRHIARVHPIFHIERYCAGHHDTGVTQHFSCTDLVERETGRKRARAGVRDTGAIQNALDRSVFPNAPMESVQHDIHL